MVMGGDSSQARVQQIFYAPNKINHGAPYGHLIDLELPNIEPGSGVGLRFFSAGKDAEEKEEKLALSSLPKKYTGSKSGGDIIGQFNRHYEPGGVMESHGYKAAGSRWRCPDSSSGIPGVVTLPDSDPVRVYSFHGSDPLADGRSHDAFSVYCQLECNGNISAAVAKAADLMGIAPPVDEEAERIARGVMGKSKGSNVVKLSASIGDGMPDKVAIKSSSDVLPDPGPIPVPALQQVEAWLKTQVHAYKDDAIRQVALSFGCATTARRYVTTQGQPATTFFGVSDSSVAGMRPMKGAISDLVKAIGDRPSLRNQRLTSSNLLHRALLRCPRMYWITDEYGYAVQMARKQQSGAQESAIAVLHDCYTGSTVYIDPDTAVTGPKERSWDECDIYHPGVTIMALLSHDHISSLAQRSEYGRGTLQQMLMCIPGDDMTTNESTRPGIPDSIIDHAKKVRSIPGIAGAEQVATIPPQLTEVSEGQEVKAIYDNARMRMMAYMEPPERQAWRGMAHGYMQSVKRMSAALAAWDNPESPCVTPKIAGWCGQWAERCLMQVVPRLEVTATDHDGPDVFQRVQELLYDRKVDMTSRDIGRVCRPFRALSKDDRSELLTKMEDDGEIIATKSKQTIKYKAARI